MAEKALWIVVGLSALALAGCLVWLLLKSRHSGRQGRLLNPLPRSLLIIAAWLILGPLVGAAIRLATGGPIGTDIMLATTGGLLGGSASWVIGGSDVDVVLTMISDADAVLPFADGYGMRGALSGDSLPAPRAGI